MWGAPANPVVFPSSGIARRCPSSEVAVQKKIATVKSNLQRMVAKGHVSETDNEAALGFIRGTTALGEVTSAHGLGRNRCGLSRAQDRPRRLPLLMRVDLHQGASASPRRKP